MSDEQTASAPKASGMQAFWWVLLVLSTAVVVGMVSLIVLTDSGNWFTVIGSACTMAVSIAQLVAIRRRNGPRSR